MAYGRGKETSMATGHGRIVGKVTYREGDGMEITIPTGPCEIDQTPLDVTISWTDGATAGSTAIPTSDYERFVKSGAIVVDS
jgi:hypothetical protein